LLALEEAGDPGAMARFQALNKEAVRIEARAREAKLDETAATDDDLVA
jgi:hypothetical protein